MIHYHGTPIAPVASLMEMAGRHFCVSYATPRDIERVHQIGQSVMLDNGAFTFWKRGVRVSPEWWDDFEAWASPWLDHWTTWAVIPDVIGGSEGENDDLLERWPDQLWSQSAPVWHMNESLERLKRLSAEWQRICIGSSGLYSDPSSSSWSHRMDEVFETLAPGGGKPANWVHMLRAMKQATEGPWPFASADSTNVAQNHHGYTSPLDLAERVDARQTPALWMGRKQAALDLGDVTV